jgi:hypothetical protein
LDRVNAKVRIDVDSFMAIFRKIKDAIAQEKEKMDMDAGSLKFEKFDFPRVSAANSFTAIDGTFVPLWRRGTTWIMAVRVAAITYGKDFRIIDQLCNDQIVLLSFDDAMTEYVDDPTMRQILRIASSSSRSQDKDAVSEDDIQIDEADKSGYGNKGEKRAKIGEERAESRFSTGDRSEFVAELYMIAKEFEMAEKVSNIYSETIIAIDGGLKRRSQPPFKKYLDGTVENCVRNSSAFIGIVKGTVKSSLGSVIGDEYYAAAIAERKNLQSCWYLEVPGDVKVRYAKMHPLAVRPFRVDIQDRTLNPNAWCNDPKAIIASTSYFASNELCLGYPFPLAEVHKAAVTLRHMSPALHSLCLEAAMRSGFSFADSLSGLSSIYGLTPRDFHFHLDDISKKGK